MIEFEKRLWQQGYRYICGVDEAGRGPLAGPVVAAAVIIEGELEELAPVNDSKKLSPTARETLFEVLTHNEKVHFGVGIGTVSEIDRINIRNAARLAMLRAILNLDVPPDVIITDAMPLRISGRNTKIIPMVKADATVRVVAAASVIAKVLRDEMMKQYHYLYPNYGFKKHKGYPTAEHIAALRIYGPSPIHRLTFSPVSQLSLL